MGSFSRNFGIKSTIFLKIVLHAACIYLTTFTTFTVLNQLKYVTQVSPTSRC